MLGQNALYTELTLVTKTQLTYFQTERKASCNKLCKWKKTAFCKEHGKWLATFLITKNEKIQFMCTSVLILTLTVHLYNTQLELDIIPEHCNTTSRKNLFRIVVTHASVIKCVLSFLIMPISVLLVELSTYYGSSSIGGVLGLNSKMP